MDLYSRSDEGTRRRRKFGEQLFDVVAPLGMASAIMERKAIVQASSIISADATELMELLHNSQYPDDATGAPAVYKSHGGSTWRPWRFRKRSPSRN